MFRERASSSRIARILSSSLTETGVDIFPNPVVNDGYIIATLRDVNSSKPFTN